MPRRALDRRLSWNGKDGGRISCATILIVVGFLLCGRGAVAAAPEAGATEAKAWQALWANDLVGAARQFAAVLERDGDRHDARRGLILAQLALGSDLALLESLKDYADGAPHSPYDCFLADWIDENTAMEGREFYKELHGYTRNLAKARDLSAVDRRRLLDLRLRHAARLGEMGEVEDLRRDLNRITRWVMLGPFDNTSGCGRDRRHIQSFEYRRGETHEGKFGQEIAWFVPKHVAPTGFLSPALHFHQSRFATAYVRTGVRLEEAGTYLLSIGYEGDVDVHVNDELVHRAARTTAGEENLHWLVDLPAGWSCLGLKVSGREELGAFSCSLSRPDGAAIDGLQIDPTHPGRGGNVALSPRRLRSDLLDRIAARAAADSLDAEAAFWDLRRALAQDEPAAVLERCRRIERTFPESGLLRLAAARAFGEIGAANTRKRELRRAAELAPELAAANLFVAGEDLERKRGEQARSSAQQIGRRAGDCLGAHVTIIESLEQDQLWEEMRKAAVRAGDRFRDEPYPLLALIAYHEHKGELSRVRELRERLLALMLPGSQYLAEATGGWEREDFGKARSSLEKLTKQMPQVPWVWQAYLWALIASERYEEAEFLLRGCLASFPQDIGLLSLRAEFLAARGKAEDDYVAWLRQNYPHRAKEMLDDAKTELGSSKQQAVSMLELALNSDPGNFQIRERIRNLQGERSYRTFLPDPKVDEIRARRVDPAAYAGKDAVVLLAQTRRFVFEERATLIDEVLAVQVLTGDGIAEWENLAIPHSSRHTPLVLASLTLKGDGEQVEGTRLPDRVLFNDLEPGDVAFLHLQVTEYVGGQLSGELWDRHEFAFADEPCLESCYALVLPAAESFTVRTWHGEAYADREQPTTARLSDRYSLYTWLYRDLPAAAAEPLAVDSRRFLPWVDITTIADWGRIAGWYADLADGQAEVEPEVVEKARELTAGCADEHAVIAAVYDFVANEITYESIPFFQSALVPRRAVEVLRDGYGDCKDKSCLMIALLRAAGVEGLHFALVTPHAPAFPPPLPSPLFRHAIVCREGDDGSRRWYDPTFAHGEADEVPRALAGVPALVATPTASDLVVIPEPPLTNRPFEVAGTVRLDPGGDAAVSRRERYRQVDHIAWLRDRFEGYDAERIREALATALAPDYPGVVVDSASVEGLVAGGGPVTLVSAFTVPELGILDEDLLSLPMPWRSQLSDRYGVVVAERERQSPVDLRRMGLCEQEEILVVPPAGRRLARPPEGVDLAWRGCRYTTRYELTGQGLRALRGLVIEGEVVPAADYPAFKDWLDAVRRDMRRAVHLRLG